MTRTTILLAAGASALLAALPGSAAARSCPGANRPAATTSPAVVRAAVICLVDAERTARHLPPLRANRRLDRSAQAWTSHLVRTHSFTHGADFAARISAVGFDWSSVGENIATGYPTPRDVVRGWMASPGHCRNILDPEFSWAGTGVSPRATGPASGGATWTQDFGQLAGASAPSANWGPAAGCPY